MKNRLRTPAQGADTISWLAIARKPRMEKSGLFWFDRKIASCHFLPWTKSSEKQKQKLWDIIEGHVEPFVD